MRVNGRVSIVRYSLQFAEVGQSAGFLQMPSIQIEVLYQTKQEMTIVSHNSIARLVLDWMKRQLNTEELTMDNLLERSHLLYLAMDNSLQDCCDLPMGHESETELVQDYKRLVLKCPNNKARRKCLAQNTRPRVLIYSRDISEREEKLPFEPDWNLIGSIKMGGKCKLLPGISSARTRPSFFWHAAFRSPRKHCTLEERQSKRQIYTRD